MKKIEEIQIFQINRWYSLLSSQILRRGWAPDMWTGIANYVTSDRTEIPRKMSSVCSLRCEMLHELSLQSPVAMLWDNLG